MVDLDHELAALRDAAASGVPMVELPVAEVRERIVTGNRLCSGGPGVAVRDLRPGDDDAPVPLRIYEGAERAGTLVYCHGGGWVTGGLDYADEFCRFLAADAGVRVVSVDYRLAPEHPFPAPVEDVAAAWRWTSDHLSGPLGLGGDSAGGNLAAALSHRLRGTEAAPTYVVLLYPVLGLPDHTASYRTRAGAFPIGAADMRWFFGHYTSWEQRETAPVDLVPLHAEAFAGLPPTHLVLVGHDPLHDEGAAYAARLSAAGVPVTVEVHPDLCHGFLRFTGASAAARAARSAAVTAVGRLAALALDPLSPS